MTTFEQQAKLKAKQKGYSAKCYQKKKKTEDAAKAKKLKKQAYDKKRYDGKKKQQTIMTNRRPLFSPPPLPGPQPPLPVQTPKAGAESNWAAVLSTSKKALFASPTPSKQEIFENIIHSIDTVEGNEMSLQKYIKESTAEGQNRMTASVERVNELEAERRGWYARMLNDPLPAAPPRTHQATMTPLPAITAGATTATATATARSSPPHSATPRQEVTMLPSATTQPRPSPLPDSPSPRPVSTMTATTFDHVKTLSFGCSDEKMTYSFAN